MRALKQGNPAVCAVTGSESLGELRGGEVEGLRYRAPTGSATILTEHPGGAIP